MSTKINMTDFEEFTDEYIAKMRTDGASAEEQFKIKNFADAFNKHREQIIESMKRLW